MKVCAELHSFVRKRDGHSFDHAEGLHDIPAGAVQCGGEHAGGVRAHCESYVQSSVGEIRLG